MDRSQLLVGADFGLNLLRLAGALVKEAADDPTAPEVCHLEETLTRAAPRSNP